MKKRTLKKVLQFGILLFGIPLLLWNCEKETLDFNKPDNLVLDISNQFNSEDFKELLPHQFLVDWSHSEKQFSEDLNDYFYEFSIIYKDKRFNPVTINKVSPRNYYHKYKIIVLEKEKGTYSFHLAKFFQEKDIQNTSLIDLEVTFNQKTGYNGLVHLYDNEGQRVFESYIYKNEKEKKAKSSNKELYKVTNQNCITIVTAHYNDYYQHIYDAFGNYLGYIFLYTEFSHYSTREECSDVVEPDYDGFEGGQSICMGSCIDIADIVEQIFCPNGDPVDADGNCDGYGEDVTPNEEPLQEQLLQIQQDYIIDLLSIDRGTPEMNWVNNDNNNVAITQIYEYLQINSFNNNIAASFSSFVMQGINALINNGEIDLFNGLIYNPVVAQDYRASMSAAEIAIFDTLSEVTQLLYLKAATQAYIYAETHFPQPVRNTKGDAFKHTFWNALSTVYIGEALTEQLTTAHENILYDPNYLNHFKETQMDYHNNAQGRQIAYGSGILYQLVQNALDNGNLRYLSNLIFQNGFWNATDASQLIPTNQ